jgi:hypothetical protein
MKVCSINGCNVKHKALGYCEKHYNRLKNYGDPLFALRERFSRDKNKPGCEVHGCDNKYFAKGFCNKHYLRVRKTGSIQARDWSKRGLVCTVSDCNNSQISKGYCENHYRRIKRNGITDKIIRMKDLDEMARFEKQYVRNEITGCFEWTSSLDGWGYGHIRLEKGKKIRAHRFSYLNFKGEIPDGMLVCHSCDNPKCVNPDHLWLGTNKDNSEDMVKKGRHPWRKFEENPIEENK